MPYFVLSSGCWSARVLALIRNSLATGNLKFFALSAAQPDHPPFPLPPVILSERAIQSLPLRLPRLKAAHSSNIPGIHSLRRPLRGGQRIPATTSSRHRLPLPDGNTSTASLPSPVGYRRYQRDEGHPAINLHSLALGAGEGNSSSGLKVEGIPFDRECDELAEYLRSSLTGGLAETEAEVRRKEYGENLLRGQEKPTVLKALWRQVSNAMTVILLAAMIIAIAIDDDAEGGFIAAIVVANVSIGFFQEYRAERVLDSLRKYSSPMATVIRNKAGQATSLSIPTSAVTIGDIVLLEAGQVVPADLRLFSSSNLQIDESILTGESITAIKITEPVSRDEGEHTSIGDCLNIAFSGTVVSKGKGQGIVYATGMSTEIGKIAETLRDDQSVLPTLSARQRAMVILRKILGLYNTSPLQRTLTKLAHFLFIAAALLVIILFAISKFKMTAAVALYAISLAVAIIPESLIAVVTTCMAKGVARMAAHKIIVLRLDAIEALGGIHDICSDKTGTITMGNMAVRKVSNGKSVWNVRGGELSRGELFLNCVRGEEQAEDMLEIIRCAALCNDAVVTLKPDKWQSNGEPTEALVALQIFAAKSGCVKSALVATSEDLWSQTYKPGVQYVHRQEYRFDPDVRRMTVVYQDLHTPGHIAFMKGAPEWVLGICSYDIDGNEFTDEMKSKFAGVIEDFANEGLRVLALAMKELEGENMDRDAVENDMTFLGLIGIRDPPRPESLEAVQSCQRAGIIVHMLTGDHISTARSIAMEVGILTPETDTATSVMIAPDFDRMTNDEIDALADLPLVVARCSPQTKAQMVKAIHRRGRQAAMTGDGVNDCPSLKIADVGIAMGLAPSDVARQASEIVLADDNFAAIVAAVEEGRRLFDNLLKFMLHLISSNFAEAIVLVAGLAFIDSEGTSVYPLSAIQILWENLITTDGSLGLEPAAGNVMNRPPRSPRAGAFNREFAFDTIIYGLLMGIPPLMTFVIVVYGFGDGNLGINCNENLNSTCTIVYKARATVFASLTVIILIHAFEMKDTRKSIFRMNLLANRTLLYSVLGGCLALFPTIYVPKLNEILFKMTDITWEWGLCVASVVFYLIGTESYKAFKRRFWKRQEELVD